MTQERLESLTRCAFVVDEACDVLSRWMRDTSDARELPGMLQHLLEVREEIIATASPEKAATWRTFAATTERMETRMQEGAGQDEGDLENVRDLREATFRGIYEDAWSTTGPVPLDETMAERARALQRAAAPGGLIHAYEIDGELAGPVWRIFRQGTDGEQFECEVDSAIAAVELARLSASDIQLFTVQHGVTTAGILAGTSYRELSSVGSLHAYEIDGGPSGVYWEVSIETEGEEEWSFVNAFAEVPEVLDYAAAVNANIRLYTQEKYLADQEAEERGIEASDFTTPRATPPANGLEQIAARFDVSVDDVRGARAPAPEL